MGEGGSPGWDEDDSGKPGVWIHAPPQARAGHFLESPQAMQVALTVLIRRPWVRQSVTLAKVRLSQRTGVRTVLRTQEARLPWWWAALGGPLKAISDWPHSREVASV